MQNTADIPIDYIDRMDEQFRSDLLEKPEIDSKSKEC